MDMRKLLKTMYAQCFNVFNKKCFRLVLLYYLCATSFHIPHRFDCVL